MTSRRDTPSDVLHREIAESCVLPDKVNRGDVRMVQLRDGLGFPLESGDVTGTVQRTPEHFQRDQSIKRHLLGEIDDTHPASTDLADDAEVTNLDCGFGLGHGRQFAKSQGEKRRGEAAATRWITRPLGNARIRGSGQGQERGR